MGYVTVDGYINDEPEKFYFSASLMHKSKEIGSMSYSPELSYRFKDWDKYKDEPEIKENYLKRLSEKEREQYLKDIGKKSNYKCSTSDYLQIVEKGICYHSPNNTFK